MGKFNYHIGKDGTPRKCTAQDGNCPYGGMTTHYNKIEEAQEIADKINESLSKMEGLTLKNIEGHTVLSKNLDITLARLKNIDYNIQRLESLKDKTKNTIKKEMEMKDVKTLKLEDASISHVKQSTRREVDSDKMREDSIFAENSKIRIVRDYLKISNLDDKKYYFEKGDEKRSYYSYMKTIKGDPVNFEISFDENNNIVLNEDAKKTISELKTFQETIEKAKNIKSLIKGKLMEQMKKEEITEITNSTSKINVTFVAEHEEYRADPNKLRERGLYDKYSREIDVKSNIRMKFK